MPTFLSTEVPLQRYVRTRVQRNWFYLDNGIPPYGDRPPGNNKPFYFVLTIRDTASSPPSVIAVLVISVYAIVDFLHAESIWTVTKASIAALMLLMWPIWLLLGCILYFSKRVMPAKNTTDVAAVQAKVKDLIHRNVLPYNPLVLVNAIYAQLKVPRRVSLPLQLAQMYALSTALGCVYVHDLSKEYAAFRTILRERMAKTTKPWLEIMMFGLDRLFSSLDGDADRLRLFEIAAKISRQIDFYEGVALPARYEEVPRTVGFLISKFHQALFEICLKYEVNLTDCAIEFLDKIEDQNSTTFRRAASLFAEQVEPNKMGNMEYNPADTESLTRFEPVKLQTQCIFAATSRVWSAPDWNPSLSLEDNVRRSKDVLTKFIITSRYEHLDGFLIEVPDNEAGEFGSSPAAVGKTMKRVLLTLDALDPAQERSMEQNLSRQSWQFTYNHQRIFITSFAPCYPITHPRYAFGSNSVWILFQPEYSFSHHQIPPSRQPGGVRQKTRDAFQAAGRPYEIPSRRDLMGHIYVKPMDDIRDPRLTWWDPFDDASAKPIGTHIQPDF